MGGRRKRMLRMNGKTMLRMRFGGRECWGWRQEEEKVDDGWQEEDNVEVNGKRMLGMRFSGRGCLGWRQEEENVACATWQFPVPAHCCAAGPWCRSPLKMLRMRSGGKMKDERERWYWGWWQQEDDVKDDSRKKYVDADSIRKRMLRMIAEGRGCWGYKKEEEGVEDDSRCVISTVFCVIPGDD